jgi:hypothetical protein
MQLTHAYEIRPRRDKRGVDLISDTLPFGLLYYGEPNAISNAIGYAKFCSSSHDAVIRVYDEAGTQPQLQPDLPGLSAMISCTRLKDSPTRRLSRFRSGVPRL